MRRGVEEIRAIVLFAEGFFSHVGWGNGVRGGRVWFGTTYHLLHECRYGMHIPPPSPLLDVIG